MKLVDNWRDFWKWHSTQAMALLGALPVVWSQIPDDAKAYIPEAAQPWIVVVLALAGIALRLRDQK